MLLISFYSSNANAMRTIWTTLPQEHCPASAAALSSQPYATVSVTISNELHALQLTQQPPIPTTWNPPSNCFDLKSWRDSTYGTPGQSVTDYTSTFGCNSGQHTTCCPPGWNPEGYYIGDASMFYGLAKERRQEEHVYGSIVSDGTTIKGTVACPRFVINSSVKITEAIRTVLLITHRPRYNPQSAFTEADPVFQHWWVLGSREVVTMISR